MGKIVKKELNVSEFCAIQESCQKCRSRGGCQDYGLFKKKSYSGTIVKTIDSKDKIIDVELSPFKWKTI